MSNQLMLTVIGNLTADPELRYTPSGDAVASFTIASNPHTYHRGSGEWKHGEPMFLRCTLWRQAAEHAIDGLTRGTRVIAHGRLTQRSYQTEDGDKRTLVELQVDEIGPSIRYATVQVSPKVPLEKGRR